MKKLISYIKDNSGETLVEALAAVMVIALTAVTIMTASIVAVRINKEAREAHIYFNNGQDVITESEVTVTYEGALGNEKIPVTIYEDNGGNENSSFAYHYYEMR